MRDELFPPMDERQLMRKLVLTGHLNVPERKALRRGSVQASKACIVIVDCLAEADLFPPGSLIDTNYDGGVIERCPDGSFLIHWKAETSCQRYERFGTERFSNAADAAIAWLRYEYRYSIDGIPIDWNF